MKKAGLERTDSTNANSHMQMQECLQGTLNKFTHLNTPPKYVPMLKNNNPKETSVTEDRRNVTFKLLSFTTHLDVVCWKVYDLRLNSFTKKKRRKKLLKCNVKMQVFAP